jgi:hypothetical protein
MPLQKNTALTQYFFYNGYEEIGTLLERTYVKKLKTERGDEEITIDACTASHWKVVSTLDITFPWRWAIDYSRKQKLSEEVYIYIPVPELLLTYKIGAVLGRLEALKTLRDTAYSRAKLWKDFYDVGLLETCKFDKGKLKKFLKKSRINMHINRFVDSLEARDDLETIKLEKEAIEDP